MRPVEHLLALIGHVESRARRADSNANANPPQVDTQQALGGGARYLSPAAVGGTVAGHLASAGILVGGIFMLANGSKVISARVPLRVSPMVAQGGGGLSLQLDF